MTATRAATKEIEDTEVIDNNTKGAWNQTPTGILRTEEEEDTTDTSNNKITTETTGMTTTVDLPDIKTEPSTGIDPGIGTLDPT